MITIPVVEVKVGSAGESKGLVDALEELRLEVDDTEPATISEDDICTGVILVTELPADVCADEFKGTELTDAIMLCVSVELTNTVTLLSLRERDDAISDTVFVKI